MNPVSQVILFITLQSLEVLNGKHNILAGLRTFAGVEFKKSLQMMVHLEIPHGH